MAKFNQPTVEKRKTTNYEGAPAMSKTPELELVTLLLNSMVEDQFYRSASDQIKRIGELVQSVDPLFAAKAVVYARREFGMRSITHIAASKLAPRLSGKDFADRFYSRVIRRVDDMTEIVAYHTGNGQKLSAAMKRGFAKAFDQFDAYQLAKYRGENKEVSLVDVVNLVHPKPTEKNEKALAALIKGELKSRSTWESKISKAGQAETAEEAERQKKESWTELIEQEKLGYLALIRNLSNILEAGLSNRLVEKVVNQLTNREKIRKSLIFPHQIYVAGQEVLRRVSSITANRNIIAVALSEAMDIAVDNVPDLGASFITIDTSGSMQSRLTDKGVIEVYEIAAVLGASLWKRNLRSQLNIFATQSADVDFNPNTPITEVVRSIRDTIGRVGHGTEIAAPLRHAAKFDYNRLIVISDNQGWAGYDRYRGTLEHLTDKPLYVIDLSGYGSMKFNENNVFMLSGFSNKIFDIMKLLETDKKALINTIRNYSL